MSRLTLHLFGSPRISVDGAPVEVDTRKAIAMLAYLAVTGEVHQRDSLAGLLWPEYNQTSARAALRRTLSALNKAVRGEHLAITRESVGLAPSSDRWMDVSEFRQLAGVRPRHGHAAQEICPACLGELEEAARLYPEPFMAGFNLRDSPNFEEWQFFQEEILRRELASALERLIFGLSSAGRLDDAAAYARRWLSLDTLNEEAHRQLMLLYSRSDQRNAALRQYRECVRILDQELGVAPLEESTRLYHAILNGEPLPEPETRLRFIQAEHTPGRIQAPPETVLPAALPAAEPRPAARPLVGRGAEWQRLADAYNIASAYPGRDGRLIALVGEAGIGKTRLAEDFLAGMRARGARVLQARCYAGETGLAYAPFIQILRAALALPESSARLSNLPPAVVAEAGQLAPEIYNLAPGLPAAPPGESGAQVRFFESLRQVLQVLLAGPLPGLLLLDDLHWADTASLDLLYYLARRLPGTGLVILAAWRYETSAAVQNLARLAGELARSGQAETIALERLNQAEVTDLVQSYTGKSGQAADRLAARLFKESEGLPFVAVEYLAVLDRKGKPGQEPAGHNQSWEMPTSVRDLLRSRLSGLDDAAQQLLSTAAVIGRSFDYTTLREASGRSELETVEGLDRLLEAGLITEQAGQAEEGQLLPGSGAIRYDFTHEKLRSLIYEETSLARRRLLHRRSAEALARPQSIRPEQAGLIAFHYEQAGLTAQAAGFHLQAGEHARRLFANVEALAHFQSALAAGHPDPAWLHEAIGDLHTLRGEYSAALASYAKAAALCQPGCMANLEHKMGNVHQRLGEWALAEGHYQASLEAAGDAAASSPAELTFRVHLFADRSLTAYSRGDLAAAQALAEQAVALAEECGEPHALAQANNMLGVLARARGNLEQAIAALEASLRAAEALADPLARIAALNNLALVYGEYAAQHGPGAAAGPGREALERAIDLAGQALALCQKRGDRHREAALHNNLADLLHRLGKQEESMAQLKQAVVIFAEIDAGPLASETGQGGANQITGAPAEIWKLTEW